MASKDQNEIVAQKAMLLDAIVSDALSNKEHPPSRKRGFGEIMSRRKRVAILVLIAIFCMGIVYTITQRPVYESAAKILISSDNNTIHTDNKQSQDNSKPLIASRNISTQAEIISSKDLLDDAFSRLDQSMRLNGFGGSRLPKWAYRIAAKSNADIIMITGRAYTPEAAATFANTIADTYFSRSLENNNNIVRGTRMRIENEMLVTQKRLNLINQELANFKKQKELYSPDTQFIKTAEQIAQLSMELEQAKADAASLQQQTNVMRKELSKQQADVTSSSTSVPDQSYTEAQTRLDELKNQRETLLKDQNTASNEVKLLDEQIKQQETLIKQLSPMTITSKTQSANPVKENLQSDYYKSSAALAAAFAKVSSLERQLARLKQGALDMPESERQLSERLQQVALLQRKYDDLHDKYQTILLNEQAAVPTGIIVSTAQVSNIPAYPNIQNNLLLTLVLGVFLSVLAAVAVDIMDNRVHNQESVETEYKLPTLAVIPEVRGKSPLLMDPVDHDQALLEGFRILRNSLAFASIGKETKSFAITSPGRFEGKSTCTFNLAVVMAMMGKKVLLVDSDLRRPSLHKIIGVPRDVGLTSVLAKAASLSDAIMPTLIDNVFFLPAGPTPPDPPEVLNSQQNHNLFEELRQMYDVVLVDCPPAAGLSDVQIISELVDGTLLVVSADQTLRQDMNLVMGAFKLTDARVLGTIFNRSKKIRNCGYYDYGMDDTIRLPAKKQLPKPKHKNPEEPSKTWI